MNSIYERGWGDGAIRRRGPGSSLSKDDFNLLMETFALAAWLGGDTRVATQDMFENAVRIMRAEQAWADFVRDNGPDVNNLAMNFYLKASERDQRGFEFTHKSFGEYLTARALLAVALSVVDLAERRIEHALTEWVSATKTGAVTAEILQFLRDEVRLITANGNNAEALAAIVRLKRAFELIAQTTIDDGLPTTAGGQTWRHAEAEQLNSESAVWCILNSCAKLIGLTDAALAKINVNWRSMGGFSNFLTRLSADGPRVIDKCLSHVVARRVLVFNLSFYEGDLEGIDLSDSYIFNAGFYSCSLRKANLARSVFSDSILSGGDLSGASFEEATLSGVGLRNVSLTDCELREARLYPKTLLLSDVGVWENVIENAIFVEPPDDDFLKAERLQAIQSLAERMRSERPE